MQRATEQHSCNTRRDQSRCAARATTRSHRPTDGWNSNISSSRSCFHFHCTAFGFDAKQRHHQHSTSSSSAPIIWSSTSSGYNSNMLQQRIGGSRLSLQRPDPADGWNSNVSLCSCFDFSLAFIKMWQIFFSSRQTRKNRICVLPGTIYYLVFHVALHCGCSNWSKNFYHFSHTACCLHP